MTPRKLIRCRKSRIGPPLIKNGGVNNPEGARRSRGVDSLEWAHSRRRISVDIPESAHQSDNVDIIEWAFSDHLMILPILLNGPTEKDMSIFLNRPTATAEY